MAALGCLPRRAIRFILTNSIGKSWSAAALEAGCTHLMQVSFARDGYMKLAS